MSEVSVLTWNTLFAGYDGNEDHRAKLQIQLLNEIRPDIFIMQEAKTFLVGGHARLYEFEALTGLRGFIAPATDTGQHVAVFIRQPIRPRSFISDCVHFHHGLASLHVNLFDGTDITFISTHLCPAGVDVRRREAAYLATQIDPEKLMLLAGDFNSASPHDPLPGDWASLPAQHRSRYASDNYVDLDHSILERLESAGWVDLGQQHDPQLVSTVPTAGFHNTEFPTMRCDYLLASPLLARACRRYEVIRNQLTDAASDHYPVLGVFSV